MVQATFVPIGCDQPVAVTLPMDVNRIVEKLNPQKIVLFGSYAYGSPAPDSDVDLLVVLNQPATRDGLYLSVSSLLRPRPFPVDLLVRTPEEIDKALQRNDWLITEVLSKGVVLYEQ